MSIIIYGESYPEISRHYYLPPPTTGTREAQMEPLGTIWNYLERPKGYWNAAQRHILTLKCVTLTSFTVCNVILTLECVTFVTFVTL